MPKKRPARTIEERSQRRERAGKGFHRAEGLCVPYALSELAKAGKRRQRGRRLTEREEGALREQLGARSRSEDGHAIHLRVRWVRCGKKGCRSCPHGLYAYEVWRGDDSAIHERYLGRVNLG